MSKKVVTKNKKGKFVVKNKKPVKKPVKPVDQPDPRDNAPQFPPTNVPLVKPAPKRPNPFNSKQSNATYKPDSENTSS